MARDRRTILLAFARVWAYPLWCSVIRSDSADAVAEDVDWTLDAAANTGDGIVTAEKLGAALDVREDVWWGPTIPLPNGPWFALSERNAPGSIIVNTAGQRYMNEALAHGGHPSPYGGTYGQAPR